MTSTGDSAFNAFWGAYPLKYKKGDAFKAWGQVKSQRPPLAEILAAISRAKRSEKWRKNGGEFIPYPATWLRAWGWEDEQTIDLSEPCSIDAAHGKGTHTLNDALVCEQCWAGAVVARVPIARMRSA